MPKAAGRSLPLIAYSAVSFILSPFPFCLFSPDFSCLMSSKPARLLRDPQLQKQAGVDFKSAENFRSDSNGKKSWYVTLGLCCSHQVQSAHPVRGCPVCMGHCEHRTLCVQNSHCRHGVLCVQSSHCVHTSLFVQSSHYVYVFSCVHDSPCVH